jgi:hypothetical protein
MGRHAELWMSLKAAARSATRLDADILQLVREWARAFVEEVGDYALANFSGVAVRVSELAEAPERHPEAVSLILQIAREGV